MKPAPLNPNPSSTYARNRSQKFRRKAVQEARASGKLTQAQREALPVWEAAFSQSATSIEKFLGLFRINTDTDDEDSEDVGVNEVQFVPRKLQRRLLRYIVRYCWKKQGRAAKVMNLKGRRYGMTTFFILFGLERILRVPGYSVTLVAQDDKMARKHFSRVRATFKQIPDWVLDAMGVTVVKDTDNEIVLRHGRYRQSVFDVAPAKRGALGRGDQVNMLILTEFPQWPKSAKGDLTGILRTCNWARGNLTVFESTARGHEEFYERCKKAWEGRAKNWFFFFVPAYMHPGSRMSFDSTEQMDEFEQQVGKSEEYGGDEEAQLAKLCRTEGHMTRRAALEHLNHRRVMLMGDYGGHLPYYHREEPNTVAEAFEGTGRPVFDLARLNAWEGPAEVMEGDAKCGLLRRRTV